MLNILVEDVENVDMFVCANGLRLRGQTNLGWHLGNQMYWAKKIIEWSPNYHFAFETITYLNNYYFLDGNTPNGFNGIAWCFGKHDRAWAERLIFGKIRYMNAAGLKRKFDIDKYMSTQNVFENGLTVFSFSIK